MLFLGFSYALNLAFLQVWNLETLQCIQILTEHTSVVMSVLCWEQFLLSASLDNTIKVITCLLILGICIALWYMDLAMASLFFLFGQWLQCYILICLLLFLVSSDNLLLGCAGVGCYSERKLGNNLYSYWRACMLTVFFVHFEITELWNVNFCCSLQVIFLFFAEFGILLILVCSFFSTPLKKIYLLMNGDA